ncbi:antibiotic biosynthesis monooxygenase [Chryseobacterium sp. GMJ5]|uniref:Antibiotic biosynthesis monooxygenase n=1 Tax=Chryseobacterium gilvum TaxID=2976534 RepID=A0ABT2VWN7_9FLAO|nr:putative quinol monooxygenase [Chryseobacterium gilvum]MCU7613307.1 antibiotic biosynthesis monooxygenase [Chryseobacterium gilvum]
MNLHIVALFKFNESYLMDAVELFQTLVRETRKEEGCLQYDLVEDKDQKGTFFLIELWESVEHHNHHNGADHLLNFRLNAAKILTENIEVYKGFKIY